MIGNLSCSDVTNDFLFLNADKLKLKNWRLGSEISVSEALENLSNKKKPITQFIDSLVKVLATFDWEILGQKKLTE